MNKIITSISILFIVFFIALPAEAADIHIKMGEVSIDSDVAPEIRNNRVMVPLRVVSENLGVIVDWSNSQVTLSTSYVQVKLKADDRVGIRNDKKVNLDVKPYLKENRMMVPIKFLTETFGSYVSYEDATLNITTEPLRINGVEIKAIQQEYHMTMGGVVQHIKGPSYNKSIHQIFTKNKGSKVPAPGNYSWQYNVYPPNAYYKQGQYDFLDQDGNSVQRFDVYRLSTSGPYSEKSIIKEAKLLLYDASLDQWHLFDDVAYESIHRLIEAAARNGFITIISNTVV